MRWERRRNNKRRMARSGSSVPKLLIFEAIRGIWCVRRRGAASYIVKLSPGAVVIDTGAASSGADVMMGLQSARVGLASVRALLLTHAHPHAAAGARALVERSGASLYASPEEARRLERPEVPGRLARLLGASSRPAVSVTGELEDGQRLFEHFVALATPGHTEGHFAFFFEPAGALFSGDALDGSAAERPEAARRSAERCRAQGAAIIFPATGEPIREGG
jgi:glyoxylase-like metal-dependent hydrolase (beta-lactamase superfamily II)